MRECEIYMMSDSDNETIRIVLRDLVDKVASEDDHYHQETIKSMLRDMVERVNDNYQTEEIEQISQFYLSSNEQISQRLLIVTDVESSLDLSHAIEVVLRDEVDRVVYDQAIDETNNVPSPCIPSSQRHVVTNTDVQQNEPVLNELHSAFDNVYEDQVTYDNDDSSAPNLHWPENPLEILSHKASERIENTDQFENRYLPLTVNVGDNVIYQGDNIDELLQIVNNIPPAMLEKPRKRKMLADKENVDQENTTAAKGLLSLKRARINDLASELSNKKAESQESYVVSARGGRRALGDITNRVANTAVCSDDAAKLPEFRIRGPKTEEMGLFMSCDGDDYDVYSVRESKSVQVDFNHLLKIVYDKDEDPARTYVDDLGMTVSLVSNQIQLGCPDIESSQTKETKWSTYQEPQVDHNNNVVDELEPGEVEGEHAEERDENDEYLEIPVLMYKGVDLLSIKAPNKKDQANTESFYAYQVARTLYTHDELVNGLFDDPSTKRATKKQSLNDERVDVLKRAVQLKFGYQEYEMDEKWTTTMRTQVNKRIRVLKPKKE